MIDELALDRQEFWKNIEGYHGRNMYDGMDRRTWFAKLILDQNPSSVLEVGCNDGANLRVFRMNNPKIELTGIDINPNAIDLAKKSVADAQFIVGSIYDLEEIMGNQFDIVFSMGVLIHVPPVMMKKVCDSMYNLANTKVYHIEEHVSGVPSRTIYDGHRWAHNYELLHKGRNVKVDYRGVIGSGGGAEHIVEVLKEQ